MMLRFYIFLYSVISNYHATATPHLDHRIIGGVPASVLTSPYQVSIQNAEEHICGGSIIHESYILTAAHCLEVDPIKSLKVRAGSNLYNKGGVVKRVCSAFVHENYDNSIYDYDIAILKLCEKLNFNQTILPVALPEFNEVIKDKTPALVTGWGYTNEYIDKLSTELLQVSLITVNQNVCRGNYRNFGRITPRMLCAGCKNDGRCDACQGDSGGPLLAKGKLMGVVSWGYGCARKEYPGVYTRVSKLRKWIRAKTNV